MATQQTQIPRNHHEFLIWIQYQLKRNRSNFAIIARRVGTSRQYVRQSVFGPNEKIAAAIAEDIKITKEQLWPERFAA